MSDPGSVDFDGGELDLATFPIPTVVCRYDPAKDYPDCYEVVPGVQCIQVQTKEGHEPPTAQFIYLSDDSDPDEDEDVPAYFEDYWPNSTKREEYLVKPGDRIAVLALVGEETKLGTGGEPYTDAKTQVIFDGYARVPQTDVDGNSQGVTFMAVSVAIRAWDDPIYTVLMRDADDPKAGKVFGATLPTRFNPDQRANCTPDAFDYQDDYFGDQAFPVFLDANLTRKDEADKAGDPSSLITFWTLDKAVAYILGVWNRPPGKDVDRFVDNPDFPILKSLLRNRAPKEGSDSFDPANPDTYDESPIILRDIDVSGMAWPEACERLLGYGGFGMRFVTEDDGQGKPWNYLEIYRRDNDGPSDPKELNYPKTGTRLDQQEADIAHLHVAHDYHAVANEIVIEGKPYRMEVSVVLAPGYRPDTNDLNRLGNFRRAYIDANPDWKNDYRLYIADECGDGHWDRSKDADNWDKTPLDWKAVMPDDDQGNRRYVRRYRPASTHLFSRGKDTKPILTQLAFSRDYAGKAPAIWDGTGTWQVIPGGYQLLKDRLGIWVSVNSPSEWDIGEPPKDGTAQEPSRILDGITGQASMQEDTSKDSQRSKPFTLRLTTTIETDYDLRIKAERRSSSPLKNTVRRIIDARDHFKLEVVAPNTPFNASKDKYTYYQDDRDRAQSHANQLRSIHEFPSLAGSIHLPYVSWAFQIGDRVSKINGRDVSLRTSAKTDGEAPTYPFIVAISWDYTPRHQSTTLQWSDRRAEPQHVGRASRT